MASNYHIQKPYVLASLPRLLALPDGACVVGEVYGLRPGVKKRRRPEVVVGIDGEAANIYDVASSRLITSYPIPPQARFSCSPCSMRLRSGASRSAATARYTYLATREPARKLSLFKDTIDASGATASATVTASLGRTADIISIYSLSNGAAEPGAPSSAESASSTLVAPGLVAVDQDGQVTCFDGESLKEIYKVSIANLSQELLPRGAVLRIEFAQMGLATDALKGLALGEGFLNSGLSGQNASQDVVVAITAVSGRQGGITRYLHVLAVNRNQAVQVHHVRLPSPTTPDNAKTQPAYRLDLLSGSLLALDGENVVTYDLARSVPRIVSTISLPGVTSFLRLSKSSILVASPTSFSVYNPVFKSLQASTTMDLSGLRERSATEGYHSCSLVSFFPQIELAVALVDSSLVAVQLEPPRTRSKKRRADGLLIDSIGRGVAKDNCQVPVDDAHVLPKTCLPGTVSAAYLAQHKEDIQTADRLLLEEKNVSDFDEFLADKFGIQDVPDWRWQRPLDALENDRDAMDETDDAGGDDSDVHGINGQANGLGNGSAKANTPATKTKTAAKRVKYPDPDRRWIVYAIGRILAIDAQHQSGGNSGPRLYCKYPKSDILNYLVDAGHLSVANVRSALRESLEDIDEEGLFLGEALPVVVAQVDPSFDLLVRWLYETKLGAVELLSAILLLMRSLELVAGGVVPDAGAPKPLLLTNGDAAAPATPATATPSEGEGELDQLDQQLQLAEYFLQHVENDPRDLALDIAIGKLGSCPALATVQGLRRIFKTDEIRSLIEVLRKQLVDQGWATRYLDMELEGQGGDGEDAATPLNYSIRLIADLLCRCIDAVRPGEWLINDDAAAPGMDVAATPSEDLLNGVDSGSGGDFFASLKWQVSAALEGVQEAMYLRGLLGEVVRYATGVQKAKLPSSAATALGGAGGAATAAASAGSLSATRPIRVETPQTLGSGMLPLGLKAPASGGLARLHVDVTALKVVSGGEVVKRSRRELGHLTSKKVGAYTLERIVL